MLSSQSKVRHFPIAMLATPGGQHLANAVNQRLRELFKENGQPCPKTFVKSSINYRFQNGEGKGLITESIRGTDLYIFVDVNNHGESYHRFGVDYPMSPDEHYADLKRLLAAAKNVVQRTTVVMPLLYEGRQHKVHGRESLDCAMALQELIALGVDAIMTIDAHNSHVQNAIPMHCFENLHATYQLIKAFLAETQGEVQINPDNLLVCSPDLGGMERARYLAEHFKVHLSGFYKVRDLTRMVNGKNPVIQHVFLGTGVEGKDVLVVDDMLASGGSMMEVCENLKELGANRIYLAVTYGLFSAGHEIFNEAYKKGMFEKIFCTNGTYVPQEIKESPWYVDVDVTRFLAKFIHTFNQDGSVTRLLDSTSKINRLLGRSLSREEQQEDDKVLNNRPPTVHLKIDKDELHS
jgi:ribose-phosphate pyrophosphokinase